MACHSQCQELVMNGRILLQPGNQKESEQKKIIPSRCVVNYHTWIKEKENEKEKEKEKKRNKNRKKEKEKKEDENDEEVEGS